MHSFVTQPLATSTVYYYKVETTDENDTIYTSNVHQIHTPSDDNVFKFLAAGDIVSFTL
jgi:hypothetical protein